MRQQHNLRSYDTTNRSKLFEMAMMLYKTNIENNIKIHMRRRLFKWYWLVKGWNKQRAGKMADLLLTVKADDEDFDNSNEDFPNGFFNDLREFPFRFVPLLYRLQKEFFAKSKDGSVRGFIVIPLMSWKVKHALYTPSAFKELIAREKRHWKKNRPGEAHPNDVTTPFHIFRIAQFMSQQSTDINGEPFKQFTGTFSTDGIAGSIHMNRPKQQANEIMKMLEEETATVEKPAFEGYDYAIGLDPGAKLMIGGVRATFGGRPRFFGAGGTDVDVLATGCCCCDDAAFGGRPRFLATAADDDVVADVLDVDEGTGNDVVLAV